VSPLEIPGRGSYKDPWKCEAQFVSGARRTRCLTLIFEADSQFAVLCKCTSSPVITRWSICNTHLPSHLLLPVVNFLCRELYLNVAANGFFFAKNQSRGKARICNGAKSWRSKVSDIHKIKITGTWWLVPQDMTSIVRLYKFRLTIR